jgi:fructan beta-fructosidase
MIVRTSLFCLLAMALHLGAADVPPPERADILIADFEGETWGEWKATGTAFGTGPAKGTLPNQMPVTGFKGKGLVNSYVGGDDSTGTLTSAPIKLQRKYINFLIGGGKHPGKACINLLEGGRIVRTATGPNDKPGGSEELDWASWDVSDLKGKTVIIQIVDHATGGWGHINIDHIVQSDKKALSSAPVPTSRTLTVSHRYLHLPVKTGGKVRKVRFVVGGKPVRELDIELADKVPTFWAFADVDEHRGKQLTIETALPPSSPALAAIKGSDEVPGAKELYTEKLRPQFHFTSRRGWLNDPNGLVYFNKEWHLFYQHNPYGWAWGNMHWGHAVSKDLLHWDERGDKLYPDAMGPMFSGSAVVDWKNTSGLGRDGKPPVVLIYTAAGNPTVQGIAYSNDGCKTFSKYKDNPVIKQFTPGNRDPQVFWHEPTKQWVMALYVEARGRGHTIYFLSSPNLKEWTVRGEIAGFFECPNLFPLRVDGDAKKVQWALYAADGKYLLGDFDGAVFTPAFKEKLQLWYGNFYAAQTFSDAPDGRHVQIGWASGVDFPGMPFNQQMTIPAELSLRTTPEGVRMFAEPVKELASLRAKGTTVKDMTLQADNKGPSVASGELLDVEAELDVGTAKVVGLKVRGVEVIYDTAAKNLTCCGRTAPLKLADGHLKLRVLVDRGSVEVFADFGRVALSVGGLLADKDRDVVPFARGGDGRIHSLHVYPLMSVWEKCCCEDN